MKTKKLFRQRIRDDIWYLVFLLPVMILLFVFVYRPMYGLMMAFQNYKVGMPILAFDGSTQWVGFKHFKDFFNSVFFTRVMSNTIRLSFLSLLMGCWVSLAAALLLNELNISWVKRSVQTMYYLPYFVSTVVVVSMITLMTGSKGPISMLSMLFGGAAKNYLNDPASFDMIYVISGIWQTFGYGSIIYLAAIAGVDPSLYEAVTVDGGNRWHRMRYVTLPYIIPTWVILMILSIGNILQGDTQKILLLYNTYTMDKADIIGTYVYRIGLLKTEYSYTTAVGLFSNIINFGLVFGANTLSRKLTDYSLW